MKIKIIKKSNPTDQCIINLSKVAAIHNHLTEGLEVFSQMHEQPAKFSDDLYDFYIAKIDECGRCHDVKATIPDILNVFYQTKED